MAMKIKQKKSMGQIFLNDYSIAKEIITLAQLSNKDTVIEVGPGGGILTFQMLYVKNLILLERDRDICFMLRERLNAYKNVKIINIDALDFQFHKLKEKVKIISNLPYDISVELLFRFLKIKERLDVMILMFQKEVADRITAKPNTKKYGQVSIILQYHFKISIYKEVKKDLFLPVPKVDSAILRFVPYINPPFHINNLEIFYSLVKKAFIKRRKTLKNSLYSFIPTKDLLRACSALNIDVNKRPEDLTIEEYANLSNLL